MCEWNPIEKRPSLTGGDPGECKEKATLSLQYGRRPGSNIHLCRSCYNLDFKEYKPSDLRASKL